MLAVGGQGILSVTAQVDDYSASHSTVSVTAYSLALGKGLPSEAVAVWLTVLTPGILTTLLC